MIDLNSLNHRICLLAREHPNRLAHPDIFVALFVLGFEIDSDSVYHLFVIRQAIVLALVDNPWHLNKCEVDHENDEA